MDVEKCPFKKLGTSVKIALILIIVIFAIESMFLKNKSLKPSTQLLINSITHLLDWNYKIHLPTQLFKVKRFRLLITKT